MKTLFLMNTTYFQQSLFCYEVENCLAQMKNIKIFFNNLDKEHKKNITFRARMNSKGSMHFDEDKFVRKLSSKIKFDESKAHFYRIMKNYDFIIVGYDSTATYELLSYKKIPFFVILPKNYLKNYIHDARKDFLILKKKKLLFDSPVDAANEINNKSDMLIQEWEQKINSIQLKNFSKKYSMRSVLKFLKLKSLIDKNIINQ